MLNTLSGLDTMPKALPRVIRTINSRIIEEYHELDGPSVAPEQSPLPIYRFNLRSGAIYLRTDRLAGILYPETCHVI